MKKLIHISIIILFLVGICVTEQILFQRYFNELEGKTGNIINLLSVTENIKTENDILYYTEELYTYWTKKENVLCTFINHKEIEDIGVEIDKMKTSISQNDKAKYEESLNLIVFYIGSYKHLMGINIQNIF